MDDTTRIKCLPFALKAIGLFYIFGIYPMMRFAWPPGWGWIPPYQEYQILSLAMYAILGIFLILAARNLAANIGLIWFTFWLNLICGSIMFLMMAANRVEEVNWVGNIFVQYLIAGVIWYLMPMRVKLLQQPDSDGK
ncbi:DUF6632 domain-containing protein [uncultured Microbulbifer sp.]|uniref:DUF6632 domain-containing protein n=1 Tax=uncultured Microbulbifer sp. TaxID=348147 RepID=UPI002624A98A|nr:DUF6632 domain-containing protein [uncultured Microbulbifer sp.]